MAYRRTCLHISAWVGASVLAACSLGGQSGDLNQDRLGRSRGHTEPDATPKLDSEPAGEPDATRMPEDEGGPPIPFEGGAERTDVATCSVSVRANLVFYANVCWNGYVECDGERVAPGPDEFSGICDLENITCDEPDRTEHLSFEFEWHPGPCTFCTLTDDGPNEGETVRCTEFEATCGHHEFEHLASGSPEAGPMGIDCDETE